MFNPFTFFGKLAASLERIETKLDREKDELPPFNYRDFGKLTFVHQGDGQCCIHGAPDTFPEDQSTRTNCRPRLGLERWKSIAGTWRASDATWNPKNSTKPG